MDHSYYRDKISAFFDGALEAQERELISRHLSGCEECRGLLERIIDFSRKIDEQSGLSGDEYFERLAQKIEFQIAAPVEKVVDVRKLHWKFFWWKVSAAAASILLVATFAYYQLEDDGDIRSRIIEDRSMQDRPALVNAESTLAKELLESGKVERKNEGGEKELDRNSVDGDKAAKRKEFLAIPVEVAKDDKQSVSVGESKDSFDENVPAAAAAPAPLVNAEKESGKRVAATAETKVLADELKTIRVDSAQEYSQLQMEEQNTLAKWRSQRDSIQIVLGIEKDTVQNLALNKLKSLSLPSTSGYIQTQDSLEAFQQLANSWYQIGLQTIDTTEKNRAIQFLNWYKAKFPVDSPMVNQQLEQLPR